MNNVLSKNAYNILGLDTSSTQKEILKRSKEISTRLKIDDVPDYENDFSFLNVSRTEDSIKQSVSNLTSPKKHLVEYFFWFQIEDDVDKETWEFIKNKEYEKAIKIWEESANGDSIKSLLHKKNLAILLCILMFKDNNSDYLGKSLNHWLDIFESDKFWNSFNKIYSLHEEVGINKDVFESFRKDLPDQLSDLYVDISKIHGDKYIVSEFSKIFGLKGKQIEKDILNPIYKKINDLVDKIENLKVSEDGVLDEDEKSEIKNIVSSAQSEFNKLIDLELYESSQVKTIRDRFANAIRIIVLDLHNNLNEISLSEKLMSIGITFCGTAGLKNKLEQELQQLKNNLDAQENGNLTIELPGTFTTNYLTFTNDAVEYKGKVIKYKEATRVYWYSTQNSTYGIPSGQTYNFMVANDYEQINASYSASFRGKDIHNENFAKILGISKGLIEPVIIEKIAKKIFIDGDIVNIGSVLFDKSGFHKKKFFGGQESVIWSDVKYQAQLSQGFVIIYTQGKNDEAKVFEQIPMSESNAVLIPELIIECIRQFDLKHEKR